MKKLNLDKEMMAKAYVEMGKINSSISEEFNISELKTYLEMEARINGKGTGTNITLN